MAYYANRRGEVIRSPEELRAAMTREQRGFVVFPKKVFDEWPVAADPLAGPTGEFRSGSRKYVWLEFDRSNPVLPVDSVPDAHPVR